MTANSDCNGTSYSAGQQQPIFRGSVVFVGTQKSTKVTRMMFWHQATIISTCPPPAHTPHSCHHPRRLDVHSPPATPDHRLATKQSSSTGTHRAAAFLRQGDEFPPSGPYLLACLLALKVVSSYSGLEILTPSKMMIRMVMIRMMIIIITIIWSSNYQAHWLFC